MTVKNLLSRFSDNVPRCVNSIIPHNREHSYILNILCLNELLKPKQGSTIRFSIHWPGGPVDFKSYWPDPAKK